jgi:hypothetical protein
VEVAIPVILPFIEATRENVYRTCLTCFLGNMDFHIIPVQVRKKRGYFYCISTQLEIPFMEITFKQSMTERVVLNGYSLVLLVI